MAEETKKTIKDHFEAFKTEMHWKKLEAQAWMRENKDAVIGGVIIVTPAVVKLIQTASVNRRHSDEERHRDRSVYDPVHHHTFECKRKIKPYEWAEIDRRKDRGESVYDILSSMRLL